MSCCPACGQVLPPKIVLPKYRQRIYDFVAGRASRGATVEEIADHIYRDDPNGGPSNAAVCVRTQIWFINNKVLRALGVEIRGKSGPQGVYRLVSVR